MIITATQNSKKSLQESIDHSLLPHNSWVEINSKAIVHNLALYKSITPQSLLAPVIKSNAYGHGIELIAQLCQNSPAVDALCVVSVSEALQLRAAHVSKPIIVLSILDNDLERAIMHDIQLVVYDISTAEYLNALAQQLHKKVFVHIKIDTGLSRLGFLWDSAMSAIERIAQLPMLHIQGIFSHLAESESLDQTFTDLQIERFNKVLEQCAEQKITIPWVHTSCSAALGANAKSHTSLVRLGIGVYGLWPSPENKLSTQTQYPSFDLQPALVWKSSLIQIKQLPAGSYIGYDRTHQLEKDSVIATLPVGYFDGYDRRLSNKGCVLIAGQLAPIVGRIAMNLMMVNVTHIPDARVGMEVVLLGVHEAITADALAAQCDTINYEIVTRINGLLPRVAI